MKNKSVISEHFCKFFSNVVTKLKRKNLFVEKFCLGILSTQDIQAYWISNSSLRLTLTFWNISQSSIIVNMLGPDNIPSFFLKDVCYIIAKPLAHVINLSLTTDTVPNNLKLARITSISKSGGTHFFDNYRPTSILPVISKVLEKCVQSAHELPLIYFHPINLDFKVSVQPLTLPIKYDNTWTRENKPVRSMWT